jgi:hypothetical protein
VGRLFVLNLTVFGCASVALLAALMLLHLCERAVGRFVSHRLGWRAVLVTGWIGVPVHELSHLCAALIFRHRIVGWSLFDPDPTSGTLGYVRHAYRRRSPWQLAGTFFIGIAPLLGGAAALALLGAWMVPPARLGALVTEGRLAAPPPSAVDPAAIGEIAHRLGRFGLNLAAEVWRARTPWLPLQLYLCAAIAAHIAPSPRDLIGGLPGAMLLALVLMGVALAGAAMGIFLSAPLGLVSLIALLAALAGAFQALHALGAALFAACFGRR